MASLSQTANTGSSHDHHGAPSGFVKRWLYSTNHKDIGTMYIIFAIVAAFIGGAMSIYMRMELMNPGVQYMEDGHVWNVFTTAHGLAGVTNICSRWSLYWNRLSFVSDFPPFYCKTFSKVSSLSK